MTAPTQPAPARAVRPAILTVDDDPGVSRAVARDLRRRYGEQHRIVRAESGAAGAGRAARDEAARRRWSRCCWPTTGCRSMNGIEFLEAGDGPVPVGPPRAADRLRRHRRGHRRHQRRRPRPLPAQAVGPAGGEALPGGRRAARRLGGDRTTGRSPETKVVGHRWSARSSEVREFLARNQVPYRWYSADEPEGERLLAAAGADGADRCRWSSPRTATPWSPPPTPSWPRHVGLTHHPGRASSTTWSSSAAARPASARRSTAPPKACARCSSSAPPPAARPARARGSRTTSGFPDGVSGAQLTDRARRQATKFGAELITTRDVVGAGGQRVGPHGAVRRRRTPSTRTRSSWPPACPTGSSPRPAWTSSPDAACTTARP